MNEVLDPVHGFITFDDFEKRIIDSLPVQRLRDIHQLALEFMVYPGATHKRFEHSLGVMHLAGRVVESLFDSERLTSQVKERLGAKLESDQRKYWHRVIRLAGLLHDVGHLPFSHTGEKLLDKGVTHEHITRAMIEHELLSLPLSESGDTVVKDVVNCCVAPGKRKGMGLPRLDEFESVMNELITGDAFGVDRMDYLLRDSLYTGAVFGKFDVERLVACLELTVDEEGIRGTPGALVVGVDESGLHAAESLLLARYFMYEQVYYHDVRRAYDSHLTDFIRKWRNEQPYTTEPEEVLQWRDSEVIAELWAAGLKETSPLYEAACRIVRRKHFRTVYRLTTPKRMSMPDVFEVLRDELVKRLGEEQVRWFREESEQGKKPDFVVVDDSDKAVAAKSLSDIIRAFPKTDIGFLFCPAEKAQQAYAIIQEIEGSSPGDRGAADGGTDGVRRSKADT